ncbi:MAG: excisionase family DNA-binding protein [Cyclobacteriaceae bacterium]
MEAVIQKTSRKEQEIASKSIFDLVNTVAAISRQKADGVKIKIQETGKFVTVPTKALDLLFYILNNMAEGKSISLVPSDSEITTQQAADMLNVSRPHIVKLLEDGIIPHKKVGSHRRILLEDVIEYDRKQKDASLKFLAEQAQDLKLGYEPVEKKMIKPILYHSFEEKEQIERDLLATMPEEKRKALAVELMSIFHRPAEPTKRKRSKKPSNKR